MKKTILLLVAICLSAALQAAVTKTVSVATAGTLHTYFTSGELTTATDLTVTGTIDARDFKFMRDTLTVLSKLDLSAVNIAAYTGTGGTSVNVSTDYAANEVPECVFFNPTSSVGKISLTSINLPKTATSIGEAAVRGCSNLTSITIPPSVTSIRDDAFQRCSCLITVDASNPNYSSIDGVLFNKARTTLIQCPLSKTGTYIIPSSVTFIGEAAFLECSGLTLITIPTSVISIGFGAFMYCTGLTSFTIPTSVTSIESATFEVCTGLTSITIPASVTSIKTAAFGTCWSLTSIYAYNTVPADLSASYMVFFGVDTINCILHVPVGSKALYQVANQWKAFFHIVDDIPTGVTNACIGTFKVSTQNGQAVISGLALGETIAIYNLQGTLIYNQPANADIVAVSLPAHGVYMVKVGAESVKVVN